MKKKLLLFVLVFTSFSATSQFGDDVTISSSSFNQKNVEVTTAFNGWVFSAISFEDPATNAGGINIRKSTDGGMTWSELDTYSSVNARYEAHDILVTGTDLASLIVSLTGVRHDLTTGTYVLFNDRYNASTGAFIGSNLNRNFGTNRVYDVELASDYLLPGVGVAPYSVAILYSKYSSSLDSLNSIVSLDGGATYTLNQSVATTGGYFRNVALSYGKSNSGSNGRYFAAWERLASSSARNGNIYTSRNSSDVASAWITPVNLDSISSAAIGLCRNPRIATMFNTIDNDSSGVTAVVSVERDYNGDASDYDVIGFYNKRAHFANFWYRYDINNSSESDYNGDLVYDNVSNNFHGVYFDSTNLKLNYLKNDFQFQTPDAWTSVSLSINDTLSLTKNPIARVSYNYALSEVAIAWIDTKTVGLGGRAKIDGESFINVVGLGELEADNISVYPNPTLGIINVDVASGSTETLSLRILDIQGRIVYDENLNGSDLGFNQKIDLSEQLSGVYLLEIRNAKELISVQRIVKQ